MDKPLQVGHRTLVWPKPTNNVTVTGLGHMFEAGLLSPEAMAAEEAKILEMHTMTDKETLGDLSLKYYGRATKPYWTIIKEAICSNPNKVHPGTVLKIPVLPPGMKK